MRSLRPAQRVVLLVCVLTGLVFGLIVDPILVLIPDSFIWLRMFLQIAERISGVYAAYWWIFRASGVAEEEDDSPSVRVVGVKPIAGYIVHETPQGKAITCMRCGMTSFNKNDVERLWCSKCKEYHQTASDTWRAN